VALFSDVDWIIIAVVAVFLLFGRENSETLRTLGRWYGRAGRLKQEILSEFSKAADLPSPGPGAPLSIRGVLLGTESPTAASAAHRGVPAAVRVPPTVPYRPTYEPTIPWTGGYPVPTWSMTVPALTPESEVLR
jgi:hypothetical protein